MECILKETEQINVCHYKDYIEAEYIVPKFYSKQTASTVISRFFSDKTIKSLPEFNTWKETLLEKCEKKESVYVLSSIGGQLIYGFYLRLIRENTTRKKYWKLNVMIGTE